VLAVGEFRCLWLAQVLSVAGDQLARVALTVLVYDRTGSAFWSAVTYAVTLVPWVLGGLALSGLADRLPRRQLMVACDLARMFLVAVMAVLSMAAPAGAALPVLVALLFAVTLLDSPFKAARSAMLPDILTGDLYVLGVAVSQTALQAGMVAGFAVGGIVVAVLHAGGALVADATFAASALLIRFGVASRPAAARGAMAGSRVAEMAAGVRLVFGSARLRTLMLFGWLVTFYVVPMGLAVPYAGTLRARGIPGAGPAGAAGLPGAHGGALPLAVTAGLIFAVGPLGTMIGSLAFSRLVPTGQRARWLGPLATACCGLLAAFWLRPGLIAALVLIAASGACAAYQLAANSAFVAAVPPERRGQAFGLANGGMQVCQGLWIVLAGAVAARAYSPGTVIAISGGIGAVIAAALAIGWRRESQPTPAGNTRELSGHDRRLLPLVAHGGPPFVVRPGRARGNAGGMAGYCHSWRMAGLLSLRAGTGGPGARGPGEGWSGPARAGVTAGYFAVPRLSAPVMWYKGPATSCYIAADMSCRSGIEGLAFTRDQAQSVRRSMVDLRLGLTSRSDYCHHASLVM
jgi:MFS family permease